MLLGEKISFIRNARPKKQDFGTINLVLITVAQALHWFDQKLFFEEARRVAKPNAIVAAWGYGLLYIDPIIDGLILEFYKDKVGPYWDEARKLVENEYRSVTFPFEEIKAPSFSIKVHGQ